MIAGFFSSPRENRPLLVVLAVFTGAVLSTLFVRMFSLSLGDLRGIFALSPAEGSWLNVALNAAQLISMTLVPWFMVVFGAEKILISASSLLLGCCLIMSFTGADFSMPWLVMFHFLIGFSLGVYLPMTISLALKSLKPPLWLTVMAAYSLRVSAGMDGGVSVSGTLVETAGWQWIYAISGGFAVVIIFLAQKGIARSPVNRDMLAQSDAGGMVLKCLSLVLLYTGVVQGEMLGWADSGLVIALLTGSVVTGVLFFIRASYYRQTFGDPGWLSNRNLRLCFAVACLYGVLMLPDSLFIPSFLSLVAGLKPQQIGDVSNIAFVIYLLFSPVAIFIARRTDPRLVMMTGVVFIAASCLLGQKIDFRWQATEFIPLMVIQSAGECLMLIGLIASFVVNIKPAEALHLGAYVSVARVLIPGLSGAMMNTYLRISYDTHSELLRTLIQTGEQKPAAGAENVIQIAALISREAHVASFIDGFSLTGLAVIITLVCLIFLRPAPPNPIVPSAG
ncbi:MFS transporter [Morganella morganii]|nr:MFS transporter [Morganella morganii]EJD6040881.1 MFS transporter [Morganella morganii]